jgi:DNA repair protein RadC
MNTIKNEEAPAYGAEDEAILKQAKNILLKRMKKRGIAMTDPGIVKDYLTLQLQELEHEQFHVLFLDNQHRLIACEMMFKGTIDGASVYPREVMKRALHWNAAALILAHNHPSGLPDPSQADITITGKLKDAMALIDVRILDHFIVGDVVSAFSERGLI